MKKVMLILALLSCILLCACGANIQQVDDASASPQVTEDTQSDSSSGEQSIELPILDEIDQTVLVGTAGSSLTAVQGAVKLLDWGVATGLDTEEIKTAAEQWLADKDEDARSEFTEKLANVDSMYQALLKDDAESLLETAGCADAVYPWSDGPVDSIEAVMIAAGLR